MYILYEYIFSIFKNVVNFKKKLRHVPHFSYVSHVQIKRVNISFLYHFKNKEFS